MKHIKIKFKAFLVLLLVFACDDLTELNKNPNGIEPQFVNPMLVMPTVVTNTFKSVLELGFGNIAGVMQHTQKDAWFSEHNDYDWSNQSWSAYYGILRNNKIFYERSVELNYEFHQGISLVMKSVVFGLLTDMWGDVPYTYALNGNLGGAENTLPAFDNQEIIYAGIIADLETANTLLSKEKLQYPEITDNSAKADVVYKGDPAKWRKLANSLLLRYYMRISDKQADVAKAAIEKIIANSGQYPIITNSNEDAVMDYVGNSSDNAWPSNTSVTDPSGSNYRRIKMCATLVDKLQELNDPRLEVWAKKVEIPLVVDAGLPSGTDEVVDEDDDGINDARYLSPDVVAGVNIDTDPDYVGLPASVSALPSTYNLNPTPGQTSFNPHVSYLNEVYTKANGSLLKARLISAAEVHFILAEAALKGWAVGNIDMHYNAGVQASLITWGVGGSYGDYIAQESVAFNGAETSEDKLKRIMNQKWIASWTAASEAWFDYRRTGLPDLQAGPAAKRNVLPVRFYYMQAELDINEANALQALDKLQVTSYSQADGKNSAWSKSWLMQGTGKPW